jgi:lipoprotein NlpI
LPAAPPGVDPQDFGRQIAQASRAGEGGLLRGARALERAGYREKAERLLAAFIAGHPGAVYARLYHVAVLRRLGRRADADRDVRQYADDLDGNDWPAPLLQVYAREDDEEDALAQARVAGNDAATRSRLTEAHFYLGLSRETDSPPDLEAARQHFEKAIGQGTHDVEADFAQEELATLERQISKGR